MDEQEEIFIGSPLISGTDLKFMGEQRKVDGLESNPQLACKRLKVLDKDYSLVSEEFSITSIKTKRLSEKDLVGRDEMSQIKVDPEAIGKMKEIISPSPGKNNKEHKVDSAEQISDLDIEVCFSSDSRDLSCSSKNSSGLIRRNILESVNSAGQLSESDSMRVWREMKRNGFLSSPLGGASIASSSADSSCDGAKSKQKQLKRKRSGTVKAEKESVKQEQPGITAPCGLLNGLNPGIMNNVRNKAQVLSVLKALVKSGFEDGGIEKKQLDMND